MSEIASAVPGRPVGISPVGNTVALSLREILEGRIVIVEGGLQLLGMLDSVRRTTWGALADVVSPDTAQQVRARELEQLHTLVTAPQMAAVRTLLETRLRAIATQIALTFTRRLSPQDSPIYLGKHFGVRIMLPERAVDAHRGEFEEFTGFLLPHGAHRDSWYNTGVNSINLWIAISRVCRGNGLLLFPDAYRREVARHGTTIDPAARLDLPIDVELNPGDILLFAGDHLHASQPNVTAQTRYVLTKRISLGAPRYHPRGTGWVPYYDTRLLGTPFEPLASLRSRLSPGCVRDLLRTVLRRVTRT